MISRYLECSVSSGDHTFVWYNGTLDDVSVAATAYQALVRSGLRLEFAFPVSPGNSDKIQSKRIRIRGDFGAGDGDRTRDVQLGKLAFYR